MRMMRSIAGGLMVLSAASISFAQTFPRKDLRFCDSWKFYLGTPTGTPQTRSYSDASWSTVCLPHTVRLESAISHGSWDNYVGSCWYRKSFTPDTTWRGKKVFLEFEAAMQQDTVYMNDNWIYTYLGGYNPFTIDITGNLVFGSTNLIAVKLNNNYTTDASPGLVHPDFYYYGGLYRPVNIHVTDSLHITDAVYANVVAGGGVFVTDTLVSGSSATVRVRTHVANEATAAKTCILTTSIIDSNGTVVQTAQTTQSIAAGSSNTFNQSLIITNPRLWSPSAPNLYRVCSQVYDAGNAADQVFTTIGIRTIAYSRTSGLQINGVKLTCVGANRHQDYGAIGGAVPASGQYRDALRLKEAGVNFVRLSHYLQNQAFLDACDKLGITVQASLVGWQYNGGYASTTFTNNLQRDLRTLIRYYRNHPCVVMWESAMNESNPPSSWCTTAQTLAHAEYPGGQMFTCGQDFSSCGTPLCAFDITQAAVQQCGRDSHCNKPQVISEFGHWEYGGFTFGGTSSNQPRYNGEAGMLQLAGNQADAMNQDHGTSYVAADAVWVYNETFGFDQYQRSLCGGGIVDVFRIPKFSYYFFQSQRDTALLRIPGAVVNSGPMVYIANFWTSSSSRSVRVYSNCSQVSLYRNGTLVATQSPDNTYPNIRSPFTFAVSTWAAGDSLRANGLIGGGVRATHLVRAPGTATCVSVKLDTATLQLRADGADLAIAYASIVDANGTVVPTATNAVTFTVSGPGTIISGDGNPVAAVAGIATVYIQTQYNTPGTIIVSASAGGLSCTGSDTVTSHAVSNDIYTAVRPPPTAINGSVRAVPIMVQHGNLLSVVVPGDGVGLSSKALFRLYTIQGRLIKSWDIATGTKTALSLAKYGRGIYCGRLTDGVREYGMRIVALRP
jgi:beta-galactosidase